MASKQERTVGKQTHPLSIYAEKTDIGALLGLEQVLLDLADALLLWAEAVGSTGPRNQGDEY